MNDLNFFSIYQSSIKERRNDNLPLYILGGIVGFCIVINLIYNCASYFYYTSKFNKINAEYSSKETQAKLAEAEEINDQIKLLTKYDDSLAKINTEAKKIDIITDSLLENISKSIPADINFTKVSTKDYELVIEGTSKTRTSVAELGHNLKQYPQFKTVHFDKIEVGEYVGDDYEFTITCVLKEGE